MEITKASRIIGIIRIIRIIAVIIITTMKLIPETVIFIPCYSSSALKIKLIFTIPLYLLFYIAHQLAMNGNLRRRI